MTTEEGGNPDSPATGRFDDSRSPDDGASIDAILEALANERRRAILVYLRDQRQATVDELIEHLQEHESESGSGRPTREDVELTLVHIHLPKLDDAGVIAYDERSEHVRYREDEQLETLLDRDRPDG